MEPRKLNSIKRSPESGTQICKQGLDFRLSEGGLSGVINVGLINYTQFIPSTRGTAWSMAMRGQFIILISPHLNGAISN